MIISKLAGKVAADTEQENQSLPYTLFQANIALPKVDYDHQ